MEYSFPDAKNKIEFISEFQKGFYKLCERVNPDDPVKFTITQLTRIFYATKNIKNMKKRIDETYSGSSDYYEIDIFNFMADSVFAYTLINYKDTGVYDDSYALVRKLPEYDTPKDFIQSDLDLDDNHIYNEDFDTCKRMIYVSLCKTSGQDYIMYFPIKVSERQATMNLYGLSKMISFAALYTLQIIYVLFEIWIKKMGTVKLDEEDFYKCIFDEAEYNPDRLAGFKEWLDSIDVDDMMKSVLSTLDKFNLCSGPKSVSREISFSTTPETANENNGDSEDTIGTIVKIGKNDNSGKVMTAIKLPDNLHGSSNDDIRKLIGSMFGIDSDDDEIEIDNDVNDNYTRPTIDEIIEFIDLLDDPLQFINIPVADAKKIAKAMNEYLSTPITRRPLIMSHQQIQMIYEKSQTIICIKAEKDETDITTFILSNIDDEYTMYKCIVPSKTNSSHDEKYPSISLAMNGVGVTIGLKKSNMYHALKNIQDIEYFYDDCINILMAWFGRYAAKNANIINPYRGTDKDNNIIIESVNFCSMVAAFEKVECFNNEYEIDAAINLITKKNSKNDFICPWMKEIKDVENAPIIMDTDGIVYAYESNAKEFTKLKVDTVPPSSPFYTDMKFQISKGNKSITATGSYLSTESFKSDIVSIFNYLKQLKKMS